MYEITEERADELMLMELTVRREVEAINASRAEDGKWQEHVKVVDELIDVQLDEGIFATTRKMKDMSARYRQTGDRRWISVVLMLRTLESIAEILIRGIE